MQRKNQLILGTILQLIALILIVGTLPLRGENPRSQSKRVPATARQAATMPEFAARLAKSCSEQTKLSKSHQNSLDCSRMDHLSPQDVVLYENGPVNGQVDAWTLNFGYSVTDSIQVNQNQIGSLTFWAWLIPGDTISNIQVSVGSSPFASDLFDGFITLTQSNCFGNSFGYNVCQETGTISGPSGVAWLTLQNANLPSGDPVYWDENSGAGCTSQGCPSQAEQNATGTIPSEAFTVSGATSTTGYQPPPCFHDSELPVIHDFTADEGYSYGVVMDNAGNLYGASSNGAYGAGMIYKMTPTNNGWLFTPLYNFLGGDNGGGPSAPIIGPEGALYGALSGGIRNCGSDGTQYCGLLYRLRPPEHACNTALCSWKEEVLYISTGPTDHFPSASLSFDQQGNLFGLSGNSVVEASPSPAGWTAKVLYRFPGVDNDLPNSLVAGDDGNLYGALSGGYENAGSIFQLAPTPDGWIQNILYSFQGARTDGYGPHSLVRDAAASLYGVANHVIDCGHSYDVVFRMSDGSDGWTLQWIGDVDYGSHSTEIHSFGVSRAGYPNYTIEHDEYEWGYGVAYVWGGIDHGWRTYNDFESYGTLAVGSYTYGTSYCGLHGYGTVWQY